MPPRRPRPLRAAAAALRRHAAPRRRRAPEEARREILDAAERLFATHHPDALGLKAVARAVGVSHALVTHYFGTYAGLVDAVLERRQLALRAELTERIQRSGAGMNPGDLLAALFAALGDPVQARLWMWTIATERPSASDFFVFRNQGLREIASEVAATVAAARGIPVDALRPEIEVTLLTAIAAAFGYSLGKPALLGALGRAPSPAIDAAVQAMLGEMVAERIRRSADAIAAAAS